LSTVELFIGIIGGSEIGNVEFYSTGSVVF